MSRLSRTYEAFGRAMAMWKNIREHYQPGTLSHVECENMDNAMNSIAEALQPYRFGRTRTAEEWNETNTDDLDMKTSDEMMVHFDTTFDDLFEIVKGRAAHLLIPYLTKNPCLFGEAIVLASIDAFEELASTMRECLDDIRVNEIKAGGREDTAPQDPTSSSLSSED